jgi:hypothetical protein
MKVGICALLRSGLQVSYYTNREIWEWHFRRRQWRGENKNLNKLLIELHPHKPRLAKRDPDLHQDVREARVSAAKSTTVIVKAKYWMEIDFGDYLFLHPPTGDLQNTELGTVILDDKYRHKIFVKGIFIESRGPGNPPPLRYGIDFSQASLDRDRRSLMTHSEAANNIARMWDTIISRAPQEPTTQKYLEILLEEVDHLEVLSAEGFFSLPSAQALLRKLVSLYPGAFFYSKEDKEISEVFPFTNLTE